MTHRSVLVVLFDGVQSLDVTGPLEVFAGAGDAAGRPGAYRVTTASLGGEPVRTSAGLRLLPDADLTDLTGITDPPAWPPSPRRTPCWSRAAPARRPPTPLWCRASGNSRRARSAWLVQRWITEHPDADLCVDTLAARCALSPRHFARAFATEVGVTPGRYVDAVRLETARRRLEDTEDGVEEVARACGYGASEAMRRAFVRALSVPPS